MLLNAFLDRLVDAVRQDRQARRGAREIAPRGVALPGPISIPRINVPKSEDTMSAKVPFCQTPVGLRTLRTVARLPPDGLPHLQHRGDLRHLLGGKRKGP